MVTLGTWCFVKPFIQDLVILWLFVAFLFAAGVLLLVLGYNNKPTTTKKTTTQKTTTKGNN